MKILEILIFGIYGLGLAFIFCYSLVQLHLTWLYRRAKKTSAVVSLPRPAQWPLVTVQLPVYNELYVIDRLIDAVMALDYPEDKLQVQVLDDSTDETKSRVAANVKNYRLSGKNIQHVQRPDRSGYKAGALQYGLASASGEYIAIFDADFLPEPDFLKQTIPSFQNPETGVVQTRWGHINQHYSLLTELQAFGLNAHFHIEQTGRAAQGHFINFNGTAGVWRKSCILDAGGWHADTLTEDLDLSYRAQLRNWKFIYLEAVVAPAELPATMPAVKSQQFRWMKGGAETARKHLHQVLKANIPVATRLHAFFHLLNSSVFICILGTALLSIPILHLKNSNPSWNTFFNTGALFILSFGALLNFYWTAFSQQQSSKEKSIFRFLPKFLLFLAMSMGLALHNSLAVAEGYLGIKTPFIRTPKFNIVSRSDTWQNTIYAARNIPLLVWLEGLLCLYFLFGIYLAFELQSFGMLPFHVLLCLGFALVCFYSVKHSRSA